MDNWRGELLQELSRLGAAGLLRRLRPLSPSGRWVHDRERALINLASNDYLALANHPKVTSAAIEAIRAYGFGAGASRLLAGNTPIHAELEARFARFKHAEAAILLPTGYVANLAVLGALAQPGDLICLDKLDHASLIDAAHLSGARVRVYPHLRIDKLARLLREHFEATRPSSAGRAARRFIVTDSVFSMDGDVADLPALCDLADRYDAILVVDEAHGTGVLGPTGAGLSELQGVETRVDIAVSTASKALGGLGGIVTSCTEVIQTLVNRARPLIYTTAAPPAQAAAIAAALDVIHDEPWRRERLSRLVATLRNELRHTGLFEVDPSSIAVPPTPIVPIVVGETQAALDLSEHLRREGLFAPAIRPPTVPRGKARVRVSLRADLQDNDLEQLLHALRSWRRPAHSPVCPSPITTD